MAFWAAIAVGVTCVLHVLLILLCRVYNRHPPPLLEFPRLELLMFLLVTQPVGQLAGRGFSGFRSHVLPSPLPAWPVPQLAGRGPFVLLPLAPVRFLPALSLPVQPMLLHCCQCTLATGCPCNGAQRPAAALSFPRRASCRHRMPPRKLSWPTTQAPQ